MSNKHCMQTLVGTHGGCFFVPMVGTWRQDDQVSSYPRLPCEFEVTPETLSQKRKKEKKKKEDCHLCESSTVVPV